jgi:hypothetical protein
MARERNETIGSLLAGAAARPPAANPIPNTAQLKPTAAKTAI